MPSPMQNLGLINRSIIGSEMNDYQLESH